MLSERPVEIGRVVKTALQSNFQYGILIVLVNQKQDSPLHPLGNDVVPKGYLEEILEQGGQMRGRNMNGGGDIRKGDRLS